MPKVQRRTDKNNGGGIATDGSPDVFVNGLNVQRPGDPVSGHCCDHGPTVTKGGSSTVFVNGKHVIHTGDADACGHVRTGGSPNVFVGE